MREHFLPAIKLTIVTLVFFSGLYTAVVYGIAHFAAPGGGNGQTIDYISSKGTVNKGFILIGQSFTKDKYFWSRPSAVSYNAIGSGGSNKGPSNPDLVTSVQQRVDTFLKHNPTVKPADIPVEMVTASGSGLDPHISPSAALIQVPRISATRGIPANRVIDLVNLYTEKPMLGLFGTTTINVLELNVALDLIDSKTNKNN